MEISKEMIKKIADLARLEIENLDKFRGEFEEILKYFEKIDNFPKYEDLPPLVNPVSNKLRLREDIVEKEKEEKTSYLKGSKTIKEDHFQVPKIISDGEEK